jgi:hypothetical protein
MNFYCIEPATKDKPGVCVLPTMEEPKPPLQHNNHYWAIQYSRHIKEWDEYQQHIRSLEKFPTSCGRVGWFEGDLDYQKLSGTGGWIPATKWEFDNPKRFPNVRLFIVPQSEEKGLANKQTSSGEK